MRVCRRLPVGIWHVFQVVIELRDNAGRWWMLDIYVWEVVDVWIAALSAIYYDNMIWCSSDVVKEMFSDLNDPNFFYFLMRFSLQFWKNSIY